MKTTNDFGAECKKAIDTGNFDSIPLSELDPWTRNIVREFLDRAGLKWQVSPPIGLGRVVKIDDKYLTYLLTIPYKSYDEQICDQFYWMIGDDPNNDDHAISPDMASAHLIRIQFPGIKITDVRKSDGSSTTRVTAPDGTTSELRLPPGFLSDKTWSKE